MDFILIVKLLTVVICAVCKLIGELCWHNAQRFMMPTLLGLTVSILSQCWWLGLTVLPSIGTLCLGYKSFGNSDGFDRGMWLFLIAVAIGLGSAITGHLSWFVYVPYCILCGVWGATTRQLNNLIIAPISGALLGSVIFFVR